MASHALCCPTMCIFNGVLWHATLDVVRLFVQSKGDDGCNMRRRATVCAIQKILWHSSPDVVRRCVLSKGDDGMQCPTSFDCACFPKTMMACHVRGRPTMCAIQRL
ncbi:hypothetical protein EJD97_012177 [Solanum chilense]|uniref:Secreted protein n=1 Tax=Solanum chilense TaxID=4083 RepID=A0A6N2AFX0_SOLCI|nr:hypothetical protein EJD97_012177 [Solanum chilense]